MPILVNKVNTVAFSLLLVVRLVELLSVKCSNIVVCLVSDSRCPSSTVTIVIPISPTTHPLSGKPTVQVRRRIVEIYSGCLIVIISGRKHKENVKFYYQKWMEDQAQSLIDATTAAFMSGKLGKHPGNAIPPPQSMGGPPMRPMGPPACCK